MTLLAILRHGPTAWTETRRIQGRTDTTLSDTGRAAVRAWRLPPDIAGFEPVSSPLLRARETAALLGIAAFRIEPRLIEMDYGTWEGRGLAELRAEHGHLFADWEARGLDFRAPGGESPREVQARLIPWLAEVGAGNPTLAIAHKGVIRALYALATGWPMVGKPPAKLREPMAHLFAIAPDGTPRVRALNLPLAGEDGA